MSSATADLTLPNSPATPNGGSLKRFVRGHVSATLILGDSETMELPTADALVSDPPYGIGYSHGGNSGVLARTTKFVGRKVMGDDKPFEPARWLNYPTVILWGANHYASRLPDSPAWLVWDKRDGLNGNDLADCEMAWTNLDRVARLKSLRWMGMIKDTERGQERIHPMQKPAALMAWAMETARVPVGATVLDPYMGSGSTGIACLRTGRNFVGVERDAEYYQTACARFAQECDGALL